jgi:hypothetical protein
MKKILITAIFMSLIMTISGCGGGGVDNSTPTFVTQIFSRPALDGDIKLDTSNNFTVTQGATSLYAGINPDTGSEFRSFLVFPLTGSGGVPGYASVDSAYLNIFIEGITILPAAASIPIRIELVSYPPSQLLASDYSRTIQPPLTATTIFPPIFRSDVGRFVSVNVTSLMREAQHSGMANFQIRILEDDGFVYPGLIEINDTTANRAPLLTVTYF